MHLIELSATVCSPQLLSNQRPRQRPNLSPPVRAAQLDIERIRSDLRQATPEASRHL